MVLLKSVPRVCRDILCNDASLRRLSARAMLSSARSTLSRRRSPSSRRSHRRIARTSCRRSLCICIARTRCRRSPSRCNPRASCRRSPSRCSARTMLRARLCPDTQWHRAPALMFRSQNQTQWIFDGYPPHFDAMVRSVFSGSLSHS